MGKEQNCGIYPKASYIGKTPKTYHLSGKRQQAEMIDASGTSVLLQGSGQTRHNNNDSANLHPPREQKEVPYAEECMDVTTEDGSYVEHGMDRRKEQQEYYRSGEEEEMRYVQKKYSNYSNLTYPKSTYAGHTYTGAYRTEFYSDGPYPTSMYANRVVGEGIYEASAQTDQAMEEEGRKSQKEKKVSIEKEKHVNTVWEMVSVISGILALISFPIWWLCPILALVSILSGILQIYKKQNKRMMIIGWICSVFGILFDGVLIARIAQMASTPQGRECLKQILRYFGYDI